MYKINSENKQSSAFIRGKFLRVLEALASMLHSNTHSEILLVAKFHYILLPSEFKVHEHIQYTIKHADVNANDDERK